MEDRAPLMTGFGLAWATIGPCDVELATVAFDIDHSDGCEFREGSNAGCSLSSRTRGAGRPDNV